MGIKWTVPKHINRLPPRSFRNSDPRTLTRIVWFSFEEANMKLCPDGTYVGGARCKLCPDGTYSGGNCRLQPDGTYD